MASLLPSSPSNPHNDKSVQATGSDAAISKVSCASKGYINDPFIPMFVEPSKRTSRRAPLINRGYYARTQSIDQIVLSFLGGGIEQDAAGGTSKEATTTSDTTTSSDTTTTSTSTSTETTSTAPTESVAVAATHQIVTLGAGSDTLFFRLCTNYPTLAKHLHVYELDFEVIVKRKQEICQAYSSLRTITESERYHIFPCDLRNIDGVKDGLTQCGFNPSLPTLILSECVLIYMETVFSNQLIEWAATSLKSSVFVTYEQIKPHDAFGKNLLAYCA